MRATPLVAPASGPYRKKPLELGDNLDAECPVLKRARSGPDPELSPCLLPASPSPAPDPAPAVAPATQLGPYVLLELEQSSCTYPALHCPTGREFTCKTHGDLHSLVRSRRGIPEPEAAALFQQMVAAVAHCHHHGLVLRDLKLRRFVFSNCERTKLVLENLEDACVLNGPDDSLWDKHACPAYVGPEILCSQPSYSGKAADVWSLGVSLFTMLAGHYPFQDSEPALLFGKIRRGTFALPEGLSAPARCLIRCLLRREPSERLAASGILLHPWLREDPHCISPSGSHRWEADQVVPDGPGLEEAEEGEVGLYG
ncbi:tribbles homolog 3 isoform X2 [Nannospalax galili]|uniref:tribbles homolog 3 isoform X2 n=1 Tax=Nannospalax galili TaxID=1026970 RepID=UPI00111C3E56|nr:tribbles homolog 3 isoform X2 [Nannospalax galili]